MLKVRFDQRIVISLICVVLVVDPLSLVISDAADTTTVSKHLIQDVHYQSASIDQFTYKTEIFVNCSYWYHSVKNCSCRPTSHLEDSLQVNCSQKNYFHVPQGLGNVVTSFDLSRNQISELPDQCFNGLSGLTTLWLKLNRISTLYSTSFVGLQNLEILRLRGNPLRKLPQNVFSGLGRLAFLDLGNTSLKVLSVDLFYHLTNLEHITLNDNSIRRFPLFLGNKSTSLLPKLNYLMLNMNHILNIPFSRLGHFTNLQELYLKQNIIRELPSRAFERLTKLSRLSIQGNFVYKSVFPTAFCSNSLRDLFIKDTAITISHNKRKMFTCIPRLQSLMMANCNILPNVTSLFQNLPHLKYLDISSTSFKLSIDAFKNSTNITHLEMNDLGIKNVDIRVLQNLTQLNILHLSRNNIDTINFTSFPSRLWKQLKEIDLSGNPFICDCSIVWFRRWLKTTNITVRRSKFKYTCTFPNNGKEITKLLHPTDLSCFAPQNKDWFLTVIWFLVLSSTAMSLGLSLLYRFRWHIRYWQFLSKTKRRRYQKMSNDAQYKYDAFVVYCDEDTHWVIHHLHPRLEIQDNIRLCNHQRDWLVGGDIAESITESISNSCKCLLIVSNAFATSNWCHFEMTMAQMRLIEADRDNLVIVLLEEIAETNVTPRLRLQMQRGTYFEWTINSVGQQLFWAQLKYELRGPDRSVINSPIPRTMFADPSSSLLQHEH